MKNHIVIKFNKEAIQSRTNEALVLKALAAQNNFLNQFTYHSIVTDAMLLPQKKINTVNFENLIGICYVQGLDELSLEEKESIAKQMNVYDFVEYAYVEISEEMTLPRNLNAENEEPFLYKKEDKIPDFTNYQYYKNGIEVDHVGIDMEYAWEMGVTGQGIQIAHIEYVFNPDHINLKRDSLIYLLRDRNINLSTDHAEAVSGILYADDLGFGVKGMVHDADTYYFIAETEKGTVGAIVKGLEALNSGDVFIYELQRWGPNDKYIPSDYQKAIWDVTQEALKAGILVVAAAGNGNEDLDKEEFDEYRSRPDNGIIRVGAGDASLYKADFSTYGSMVHLQAWGTWNVVTTGFGDLYDGGLNKTYTASFSGTSSATPIVASAIVAVQSWYKQETGDVLSPLEMRDLLIETGIPQRDLENGHIGPMPNVRNAINKLRDRLNPPEIKAVIHGPMRVNGGKKVMLSGESSISNVAEIISYDWQLPEGMTADRLDLSTLTFISPDELAKTQKFLIGLTVTDKLNNSNSVCHLLIVNETYPLWARDINYWKASKVSWKDKNWKARVMNMNVEPGTDSKVWIEL